MIAATERPVSGALAIKNRPWRRWAGHVGQYRGQGQCEEDRPTNVGSPGAIQRYVEVAIQVIRAAAGAGRGIGKRGMRLEIPCATSWTGQAEFKQTRVMPSATVVPLATESDRGAVLPAAAPAPQREHAECFAIPAWRIVVVLMRIAVAKPAGAQLRAETPVLGQHVDVARAQVQAVVATVEVLHAGKADQRIPRAERLVGGSSGVGVIKMPREADRGLHDLALDEDLAMPAVRVAVQIGVTEQGVAVAADCSAPFPRLA